MTRPSPIPKTSRCPNWLHFHPLGAANLRIKAPGRPMPHLVVPGLSPGCPILLMTAQVRFLPATPGTWLEFSSWLQPGPAQLLWAVCVGGGLGEVQLFPSMQTGRTPAQGSLQLFHDRSICLVQDRLWWQGRLGPSQTLILERE